MTFSLPCDIGKFLWPLLSTLNTDRDLLVGELHTGDGVSALSRECEILAPVLRDQDLAQANVGHNTKCEILIYQVRKSNPLTFFDASFSSCEKETFLAITI